MLTISTTMRGGAKIFSLPTCLLGVMLILAERPSFAAGFLINEHGSRSTGRADAVVATVADGSAIFYNPAGLGRSALHGAYVGTAVIFPEQYYRSSEDGTRNDAEENTPVIPHLYGHTTFSERYTVGIGVNAPFGSTIAWGEDSPGRFQLRKLSLQTLFVTPAFAADLGDGLRFGLGADFVPARVFLSRDLPLVDEVGRSALAGNAFGYGGRVGVQYNPTYLSQLNIGLSYKTPVRLDFTGLVDFDVTDVSFRSALPPDGPINTAITLPGSVWAGISYRLAEFEFEADVNWVGWSSYQRLTINLPDGSQTHSERNYRDTWVYRLGVEYAPKPDCWAVRAGYASDQRPALPDFTDFTSVDANRHLITMGGTYHFNENLYLDVAALHVLAAETINSGRQPNQIAGVYGIDAWLATMSIGWQIGHRHTELQPRITGS